MLLSIIIPVYNVERYIRRCIESCLEQEIESINYEIIIVNDGTLDKSMDIVIKIINTYDNIRIVNKTNGGLSSARNAVLKMAQGEYLWFVDSDDWINNCLNTLVQLARSNPEPDIFAFNTSTYTEDGTYIKTIRRNLDNNCTYDGLQLFRSLKFPYSAVQFYIFKKKFLNDYSLFFKEGALYDDWQFIIRAFVAMNGCYYSDITTYNYRLRNNSISTSKATFKHIHDCIGTAIDYHVLMNQCNDYRNRQLLAKGICVMIKDVYKLSYSKIDDKTIRKQSFEYFKSKRIWFESIIIAHDYKAFIVYILLFLRSTFNI